MKQGKQGSEGAQQRRKQREAPSGTVRGGRSSVHSTPRTAETGARSSQHRPAMKQKESDTLGSRAAQGERGARPVFARSKDSSDSFAQRLQRAVAAERGQASAQRVESLAEMPYDKERQHKAREFREWWKRQGFAGEVKNFVAAPQPRGYRATTKRTMFMQRGGIFLGFGDQVRNVRLDRGEIRVVQSAIEPKAHYELYTLLAQKLVQPTYRILAENMNGIVIRDTGERAVILNVKTLSGDIVRKARQLSAHLENSEFNVVCAWLYHDPSESEYYLDQKDIEPGSLRVKKLFGFDFLQLSISAIRFRVSPFSFSQVNLPMLQELVNHIETLVPKHSNGRLLDCYCGYGVFSHCLSTHFSESVGLDSSAEGIASAKELYARRKRAGHSMAAMHFSQSFITPEKLKRLLPPVDAKDEVVLLDPPRQGCASDVIQTLAERTPAMVIHIFCAIEEIPRALRDWKKAGYIPATAFALDMFAGTPSLETVVVLKSV